MLQSHTGLCSQSIPKDRETASLVYSSTLSPLYSFSTSDLIFPCQHEASAICLLALKNKSILSLYHILPQLSLFSHRLRPQCYATNVCFNHPHAFLLWWISKSSCIDKPIYLNDQRQLGGRGGGPDRIDSGALDWWREQNSDDEREQRRGIRGGGVPMSPIVQDGMQDDIPTFGLSH